MVNRPFYPAIGSGESAKFWLGIVTELTNRGVVDVFSLVCDAVKGMPDSATAIYRKRSCVVHLIRNTFKYASKRYSGELARDVKTIYPAANAWAAWAGFEERP